MGTARSEHLHFSIDGEWLTEHSRNPCAGKIGGRTLCTSSSRAFMDSPGTTGSRSCRGGSGSLGSTTWNWWTSPRTMSTWWGVPGESRVALQRPIQGGAYYYRPPRWSPRGHTRTPATPRSGWGPEGGPSFGLISNATSWSRARTLFYARDRLTDRVESDSDLSRKVRRRRRAVRAGTRPSGVDHAEAHRPGVPRRLPRCRQAAGEHRTAGRRPPAAGEGPLDVVNAKEHCARREQPARAAWVHGHHDDPEIAEVSAERIIHADRAADALAIARGSKRRSARSARQRRERQRVQRLHERVVAQASAPTGWLHLPGTGRGRSARCLRRRSRTGLCGGRRVRTWPTLGRAWRPPESACTSTMPTTPTGSWGPTHLPPAGPRVDLPRGLLRRGRGPASSPRVRGVVLATWARGRKGPPPQALTRRSHRARSWSPSGDPSTPSRRCLRGPGGA